MTLSFTPILFALQLTFLFACSIRAQSRPAVVTAVSLSLIPSGWGALSATLALAGVYDSRAFLAFCPASGYQQSRSSWLVLLCCLQRFG